MKAEIVKHKNGMAHLKIIEDSGKFVTQTGATANPDQAIEEALKRYGFQVRVEARTLEKQLDSYMYSLQILQAVVKLNA